MIYSLRLSDAALSDLTEIIAWYEGKTPALALNFERQVNAGLELLVKHPLAFAVVKKRVRKINLPVFPYSVFYEIHANSIVVLAVLHHSRYPRFE